LNEASITCRTAGSLIANIRRRIKGHGRGSIRARHDVVVDVAVDVAVNVAVNVAVAVAVDVVNDESLKNTNQELLETNVDFILKLTCLFTQFPAYLSEAIQHQQSHKTSKPIATTSLLNNSRVKMIISGRIAGRELLQSPPLSAALETCLCTVL